MKNGVRYAFTGNVHDPAGQATYCHNCQALLIGRDGYENGVAPERRRQLRHVPRPLRRRFQWLARRLVPVAMGAALPHGSDAYTHAFGRSAG